MSLIRLLYYICYTDASIVDIKDCLNMKPRAQPPIGGSIFGGILQDIILPDIFQGTQGNVNIPNFRASASQTLLDIGKSITRSEARNG
jgi:hypothetical protein